MKVLWATTRGVHAMLAMRQLTSLEKYGGSRKRYMFLETGGKWKMFVVSFYCNLEHCVVIIYYYSL